MTELETAVARLAAAAKAAAEAAASAGNSELAGRLLLLWAEFRGVATGLTEVTQGGNPSKMVTAERVRVSRGRKKRDALVIAANTKNYTLRSLAEQLKGEGFEVTHSLLSQARTGKKSISEALAKRIEKATDFPASQRNWPRLRKE